MKIPSAEKQTHSADKNRTALSSALLNWYDEHGRDLPWRVRGAHPNPYMVWISEIMLQQTTVKTVIPYFYRFLERFPDIFALADADIEDVFLMWQGLGYYTRARKLHECAQFLVQNNDGRFPETYAELLKLPGIGPYTAASISSLAFDKREAVVDGNVIRVISRLYGITENTAVSLPEIKEKAQNLMSETRAADYTSAIMDLGATVCTPKNPDCSACPFEKECEALAQNLVEEIPKIEKLQKIGKTGKLFWIENESGDVLIRKRTEKGLLHGLTEFPWEAAAGGREMLGEIPFPITGADWIETGKSVRHVFTHINLTLEIYQTTVGSPQSFENLKKYGGEFVSKDNFKDYPFSTLMKKVIKEIESDSDSKNKKTNHKKTNHKKTNHKKTNQNKKVNQSEKTDQSKKTGQSKKSQNKTNKTLSDF
ncbi:Adenine DNA glycosylase [Methanimicrococcus sp. At1]|uniref:Adenine DNA glycosylase n=1 Tax=Methanimicrococcus hacksteinii TaxID=3028293 RepID=A0ABU3VNF8_9EURY|nr:A/G-specific adenine glycosylase [Methanimicrococcus sp. At1]MDV0444948.1 Adenine DNA glycosylase [Methanimicrococcus sp. At1]